MPKYRVYREDSPDDFVVVDWNKRYSPMSIKGEAIHISDRLSWGDYTSLRVSSHKEVD